MIQLQIVMVSPQTHLVKNRESQSITNESQLKKQGVLIKLKMLGPLCNQIVNLETDAKTLYYSSLKKELIKRTGYYTQKIFKSIHHSLRPMGRMSWMTLCLWRFLCVRDVG